MPIFATLHMPGMNPIGPPSLLAAVVVAVIGSLTCGLVPVSAAARRKWTTVVPWVTFVVATCGGHTLLGQFVNSWRFWDADDFFAGILYLVAGFLFAMQNLRYPSTVCRGNVGAFNLLFGIEIGLRAFVWQLARPSTILIAEALLLFCWLLTMLFLDRTVEKWQLRRDRLRTQADVGRFQFSLRGLLMFFVVVAMVLAMCRSMLNRVKQERAFVDDFRLEQELRYLNLSLPYYLSESDVSLPTSGGQIAECLITASPRLRQLADHLQSAGLDLVDMDDCEAVVFCLSSVPPSAGPNPATGRNARAGTRLDWKSLLSPTDLDPSYLVDRDGDRWPEYVFQGWSPDYPSKVFRLAGNRIVASECLSGKATATRRYGANAPDVAN